MWSRRSFAVGFSLFVAAGDHSAQYETAGVRYWLSLPMGARIIQDEDVVKEWEADGLVIKVQVHDAHHLWEKGGGLEPCKDLEPSTPARQMIDGVWHPVATGLFRCAKPSERDVQCSGWRKVGDLDHDAEQEVIAICHTLTVVSDTGWPKH